MIFLVQPSQKNDSLPVLLPVKKVLFWVKDNSITKKFKIFQIFFKKLSSPIEVKDKIKDLYLR